MRVAQVDTGREGDTRHPEEAELPQASGNACTDWGQSRHQFSWRLGVVARQTSRERQQHVTALASRRRPCSLPINGCRLGELSPPFQLKPPAGGGPVWQTPRTSAHRFFFRFMLFLTSRGAGGAKRDQPPPRSTPCTKLPRSPTLGRTIYKCLWQIRKLY